jgi:hypothetical protein
MNFLNISMIFLITIVIAFLFGIVLISVIDNRLTNIKLNIPKQDIIIKYPIEHFADKKTDMDKKKEQTNEQTKEQTEEKKTELIKWKAYDAPIKNITDDTLKGFDQNVDNKEPIIEKFNDLADKNKQDQVCYQNHEHNKNKTSATCVYGVTNYADPIDMSPLDKKIFMTNYPPNMTMQDYINWLYTYIGLEDQLSYTHLKNLEKLKNGKKLIEKKGICPPPPMYNPPNNAKDYFEKLYNDNNEFNIAPPLNSVSASIIGFNYNEYPEFSKNKDVYGTCGTLRNSDIYLKKTAKMVDNYILPKDSNNLGNDKLFEKYYKKNIEI